MLELDAVKVAHPVLRIRRAQPQMALGEQMKGISFSNIPEQEILQTRE